MGADDEDSVDRFRDGDDEIVARVIAAARAVVFHRGYYIPADAREELIQEAVLQVYRTIISGNFRLRHRLETLTRTIAHRRCVDWLRRQRDSEPFQPETCPVPAGQEQRIISKELVERARRIVESLGFACAQLIRLRLAEGLSYAKIAHRLGRSEAGVRVHLHKCLKRARQMVRASESAGATGAEPEDS